jgi:small conductance mechanosensitive channel
MQSEPVIVSQEGLGEATTSAVNQVLRTANALLNGDFSSLSHVFVTQVVPAALGILALMVAYFVAKFASRIFATPIRERVDETLGKFIEKLVFYAIMVATIVGVISSLGVNVTSFAAVLAAAGFAIGLAFQGTLSNFAAGILLLVFRPFKVGDRVVVAGVTGVVHEIDLFCTAIDTTDNRRIIVPNSSIAGNTIENMTHHAHRRIEVGVGIAYECDLAVSRKALMQAVESIEEFTVTGENRDCQVIMMNLGPHSVDWIVRAWVNTPDVNLVKELLTAAVKDHLDAAGLKIPFPQLDIHWQSVASQAALHPHTIPFNGPATAESTFTPRRRSA